MPETPTAAPIQKTSPREEVYEEIEKEELKKKILKELGGWSYYLKIIGQNPLLLLILTFALTNVTATWLTNNWQRGEWDRQQTIQRGEWNRQQERQVQIRTIEQKHAVIDELTKAVAEYDTATLDVLESIGWEKGKRNYNDERVKRIADWKQKSIDWRNKSRQLQNKLYIYFKDPNIHLTYEKMIIERNQIDREVSDIALRTGNHESNETDARDSRYAIKDALDKNVTDLKRLVGLIIIDIQNDKQQTP